MRRRGGKDETLLPSPNQRLARPHLTHPSPSLLRIEFSYDWRRDISKTTADLRRFIEEVDLPATPPPGLELHLFAGDSEKTLSEIVIDSDSGKVLDDQYVAGDGTATRSSAVHAETIEGTQYERIPWTSTTFLSSDHRGLTRDRVFVDNVLSRLLAPPANERMGDRLRF